MLHVVRYHKLVIVWYNAFDNAKFIEQGTGAYHYGVLEINLFLERGIILNTIFFFKQGPNLETGRHVRTQIIAKYPPPGGGLHPMCPLIKTLRWDDLREGGDASKIIFLRVLSGHLSTTRFDRLSRFLNHNYEIDFSGNSY